MGKNKLEHFAEMKSFHNLIEAPLSEWLQQDHPIKGRWNQSQFNNNNPIILELGCGKGEYTIGMAQKFTNQNFIGIDIKGARMWRGAKTGIDENIANAAFLRTRIDFIEAFFAKDEVSEIWLTFSDPHPQKGKARKRLSSPWFINRYRKILKPNGVIHLKTDSDLLYQYTLEQIKEHNYKMIFHTNDLYGVSIANLDEETKSILKIRTHYESIFLSKGITIKYVKFGV